MNGFQQKQVDRMLSIIPVKPLSDWEKDFLADMKRFWWKKDLQPMQNSKLTEILKKFA